MAAAVSLMDYAGGGAAPIAVTSRTARSALGFAHWVVTLTAAYSFSVAAQEADLTAGATEKAPRSTQPAFTASTGRSVRACGIPVRWRHRCDPGEQEGQVLYGYMRFGGWKIGAAYNMSSIAVGGADTSDRNAWTVPVGFTTARITSTSTTQADDDDVIGGDNAAKMWAFAYVYDLSKRTSMGVTVAKLDNAAAANYSFFTNTSGGGLSSANTSLAAGEDGQLIAFTVRHAF